LPTVALPHPNTAQRKKQLAFVSHKNEHWAETNQHIMLSLWDTIPELLIYTIR